MTPDYFSVLHRATSALNPNTPDARREIYDRALRALAAADLSQAELTQQRSALESAIEDAESQFVELEHSRSKSPREAAAPFPGYAGTGVARVWRHSRGFIMAGIAVASTLAAYAGYQYWIG